jgi:hypothetical protein
MRPAPFGGERGYSTLLYAVSNRIDLGVKMGARQNMLQDLPNPAPSYVCLSLEDWDDTVLPYTGLVESSTS